MKLAIRGSLLPNSSSTFRTAKIANGVNRFSSDAVGEVELEALVLEERVVGRHDLLLHLVETRIALVQELQMRLVLSGVLALLLAEQLRLAPDPLVPYARQRFAHGADEVAFEGRADERDGVEQISAAGIPAVPLEATRSGSNLKCSLLTWMSATAGACFTLPGRSRPPTLPSTAPPGRVSSWRHPDFIVPIASDPEEPAQYS